MGKIIKQISQALKNSKYTEAKMFNLISHQRNVNGMPFHRSLLVGE